MMAPMSETPEDRNRTRHPDDRKRGRLAAKGTASTVAALLSDQLLQQTKELTTTIAVATRSPIIELLGQQVASNAARQIMSATQPTIRSSQALQKQISDLGKLTEPLQQMVNTWVEIQQSRMRPLVRRIEEDQEYAREIGPYFERAGIWFSGGMPLTLWSQIKAHHNRGELTAEDLVAAVVETYHQEDFEFLEATVSRWWNQPILARWKRHIEHALSAHRNERFTLTVPTLILVCEDVMRQATGMETTNMRRLSEAIQEMQSEWSLSPIAERPLAAALDRLTHSGGLLDALPEREPDRWHRNRNLHGNDPDYDTALNSLRLFILLDELHTLINGQR